MLRDPRLQRVHLCVGAKAEGDGVADGGDAGVGSAARWPA